MTLFEILGAVGLLAFAMSSISVGVACIVRGLRTRAVPELSVGVGFLVGVLFGYLPESVATSTGLFSDDASRSILMVTQVSIRIAAVSVMVFTVAVFGWRGVLGRVLFTGLAGALIVSWVAFPHYPSYAETPGELLWYEVFSVARALAAGWGAVESLAYYRMARRRSQLGLADPVVANRFLLWGLGLTALTGLMGSTTLAGLAGVDPTAYGWVLLESALGLVGAIGLWLAFFPPRLYIARLQREGAAPSPA